jgi:ApeA N-terminal domain 1
MGMELGSSDASQICSSIFHFAKIHQWFPTALGIRWEEGSRSFVVPTKESEVFSFRCAALGAEVTCETRAHGGVKSGRSAKIKSTVRITVKPDELRSVDWFYEMGTRLENFFTLCLGTSVSLKRIQFVAGEKNGHLIRNLHRVQEKFNAQLSMRCPPLMLSTGLDRWLSVPLEKRPVERTLFGILKKSPIFVETEFLSLAQALEGFNRIHGAHGRKEFAKRINETYEMLTPEFALKLLGKKDKFVRTVVDTRNVYTHLGIAGGTSAILEAGELFDLNQRLHAFLRCVMLVDLGFEESLLRDPILYQATRWRLN